MNDTSAGDVISAADIRNTKIVRIKKPDLGGHSRRRTNTSEAAGELGLPRTHFDVPPSANFPFRKSWFDRSPVKEANDRLERGLAISLFSCSSPVPILALVA